MTTSASSPARNGSTLLEWDERGRRSDPTVLLIMGLGAQMTAFREAFCDQLADRGHHVMRFDNRDAGLSTRSDGPPPSHADLARMALAAPLGRRPLYTLADMALDAIAVLDAADVRTAHVVGVSMGGMVAQKVAIHHPDRVSSLVSIMSKPGGPLAGRPRMRIMPRLLEPRPTTREAALRHDLDRLELISGPHFDRKDTEAHLERSHDRSFHPDGMAFQLAAILADGDRTSALRSVAVPTLVVHGRVDPLVTLSGGVATARSVPGASLLVHQDMGHDLSRPLWDPIIDDIASHVKRAETLSIRQDCTSASRRHPPRTASTTASTANNT